MFFELLRIKFLDPDFDTFNLLLRTCFSCRSRRGWDPWAALRPSSTPRPSVSARCGAAPSPSSCPASGSSWRGRCSRAARAGSGSDARTPASKRDFLPTSHYIVSCCRHYKTEPHQHFYNFNQRFWILPRTFLPRAIKHVFLVLTVYEEMVFSQSSYRLNSTICGSVAFRIKSPNFSTCSDNESLTYLPQTTSGSLDQSNIGHSIYCHWFCTVLVNFPMLC